MAEEILHGRAISPWIIPNKGGSPDDFHGLTNVGADPSVASEKVYVIGKTAACGTDKETPVVTVPLPMLERGEIDSYLTLANLDAEPSGGFDLLDFNSSLVDVVYYIRDANAGNVVASMWMPKCALNSLAINFDDPKGRITRDIEVGSDDRRTFLGGNKYLIHLEDIAGSGVSGSHEIDVSDPAPVVDPNVALSYILRIDRTRAGVTTSLAITTDYTYTHGTFTIDVLAALADDVYNVYYSAASFGTPADPTSIDSDSVCYLKAENITVLIDDGVTELEMDRLSSLSISVTINRIDENVLGNDETILREITDTPVTVAFSGRIKNYYDEKAWMAQLSDTEVISSVKLFSDAVKVSVKIYDNAAKDTFLIGYQVDQLSYTDGSFSTAANEFGTMDVTAEADNLKITTTEGDL